MLHMKILRKCGGELEHALRSKRRELCSTEEYINTLDNIVTRTKIGRTWKILDIKSPNKLFIRKDKPREPSKPNKSNTNGQGKCHKCGGIKHLPNNCLKKAEINEIMENKDNIDREEESDSEDTEESDTSESDEINKINSQINNIYLIYEAIDVKSNLPKVEQSDTSLTNVEYGKLHGTKHAKVMGYTAGKSNISIFIVENKENKVNLDTGEYCTCVGKGYLQTIKPDWAEGLILIQGVKFSSASESMKPLGIIDSTLIFTHPSQLIRVKVESVVMKNCTSNHFILGNDYISIYMV
ncbi:hypothetical protein O181_085149 [Austropuccinia psidii MF-1]|uniref:Uncharacterized protein n=1 Tax=Austropuccinia psidii MF-1 TaxID=1389203 RepID=A0A9Q3FUQ6_9BASI|nr:hypothetical protein [Austropuccinia psidii MF-1]